MTAVPIIYQEGGQAMTKQEEMEYRRSCPYDAMGDYSDLFSHPEEKEKPDEDQKEDTG